MYKVRMIAILFALITVVTFSECFEHPPFPTPPLPVKHEEISPVYWENLARKRFAETMELFPEFSGKMKKAKNVIMFLGDGMGLPTISAARFYKAEVQHASGESHKFSFEDWDFNSVCRTYDLETMVTDSASSATAYLTGTKTRTGMLGVTGAVQVKQCTKYKEEEKAYSALHAASKAGKATGIVTSARVTHASPAGAFGHISFRDWESDSDIAKDKTGECTDLAKQLALDNLDINVILGGGQAKFYPKDTPLPSNNAKKGERSDGHHLPAQWLSEQEKKQRKAKLIENTAQYRAEKDWDVDYLFGLLEPSHLDYKLDKAEGKPTLTELTETAIKILQRNENGFFLFVEGARIDHGHHDNKAKQALSEMIEFAETIEKAQKMVDLDETLLIVTADHSHSFELVGQPSRFESLLTKDKGYGPKVLDNKSMIPASYASGPGAKSNETRLNVNDIDVKDLTDKDFLQQALIPLSFSAHGGDDVAVYANGLFSWMFHRTMDNTFIAQTMKFAMCAEPYTNEPHCNSCQKPIIFAAFVVIFVRSIIDI